MSLVITNPPEYAPAYNPVIVRAVSNVTDQFTVGSAKELEDVSNVGGYSNLQMTGHGLMAGDFILITVAPGAENLLGVGRVTTVVDTDNVITNWPYFNTISDVGIVYKYVNNYSVILYFYSYVLASPTTPILKATKVIKPAFEGGVCVFEFDLSSLIQGHNYAGNEVTDVLSFDLPSPVFQVNNKSFVKYGFELFEAADAPIGGNPEFIEIDPSS